MGSNLREKCFKMSWAAVLILLLVTIPTVAQLPTGTILGNVKDTSGASVPGASVTIQNVDTGFARTVTTGSDGTFNVPELATGPYQVQATHEGFKTAAHTGISLEVTEQAVVNLHARSGDHAATGYSDRGSIDCEYPGCHPGRLGERNEH
jgi:hypothetical protein